MSFDREKLRRTAEKNLAQGKIAAAIKDYSQIVENDQRDYNSLNMLGDLYVRSGKKDEAIRCFARIADHYDAQGFTHKAIAMYKKIGRLKTTQVDIAAKLAPLYQTLGLVAEARANFQIVAEDFQKNGQRVKALEVWQQIADLDPNDTATRIKLAESFLKENEKPKAVEAYTEAGQRLLAKKQYEPALAAFNSALELHPNHHPSLTGATLANIALGFPEEAAEKLEDALNVMPDNVDLLSLLAHCYIETGNADAAERATQRLVEKEPSSYKRLLEVSQLHIRENDLTAAVRSLDSCAEQLLSNGQETELENLLNEILARDPEHLKTLRLLARLRGWQRDELELKDTLERLAEAARLGEELEEERNALIELRSLFPAERQYAERLREIVGDLPFHEEFGETEQRQHGENNVPSFESFAPFVNEHETGFDFVGSSQPEEPQTKRQSRIEQAEPENARTNYEFESNYSFDQPAPAEPENAAVEVFRLDEPAAAEEVSADFEVTEIFAQEPAADKRSQQLRQELESVDFYIEQGYNDLALESLRLLETQFGGVAEIKTRLDSLSANQHSDGDNSANGFEPAGVYAPAQNESSSTFADFEIKPETFGAAQVDGRASSEANSFSFETEIKPAPEAKRSAPHEPNPNFADLLAEFGEDLHVGEIREVQTADYETHYNLGLAYKEMALYDDAVEEFQTAVKMVAPDDGTSRYLQCCNLIGHCFVEKGMPKLAATWYRRALESPGHSDEEHQALLYELGTAYEHSGETDKAVEIYGEIYAVDVAYRSVSDKLRSLQAMR